MNRPISVNWTPAPAQATPAAGSVSFGHSYNKANQRIGQTVTDNSWINYPAASASTTSYTANALNQYTAVGAVTPGYDGNGNLTSDGTFTLGYDAENRLVSASGAGNTASYTFDAQGRRKTKTVNGTTTVFVTDADNREVLEYDGGTGAVQRWYAYGLGPNAVLNQMNVAAATRATLVPDILGSVVGTMDSAAASLSKVGYLPYGKSGSSGPFGFTGQRIDLETAGLYYYRARHYSPAWGRFLQADPIGYAGGAHLYRYVSNDPLNGVDPNGLFMASVLSYLNQTAAPELEQSQALTDFVQQHPTAAKIEGAIGLGVPLGIAGAGALGAFGTVVATDVAATAEITAANAQAAGATRGVAAALRVGENVFTDISSGAARQIGQTPTVVNPTVQNLINNFAENSAFAGRCAEIGCISQALNAGVNPSGGTIATAAIRALGSSAQGTAVAPCITCAQVGRLFGIRFVP